ncbi:hypothetical protein DOY81_009027 [Sarcophaga bullata]|nr:hypothetical protein DOY81_009027 [Sarcophaga bullata]
MDEVDKIIIHSLKQIGCKMEVDDDSEIFNLNHFTPDLLVRAVSKCLQEIKSDAVIPKSLPENMAQRFTVATSLAELCSASGYRGDIGYQTFLYPNVVDIRRLFMFLIEQLPKEQIGSFDDTQQEDKDDFNVLMKDIRKKISKELKLPWVPQYCRGVGNRKNYGSSCLNIEFLPQLNLNIPHSTAPPRDEVPVITYQIPNIFQQISLGDYDLVSSVLHKNAIDVYAPTESLDNVRLSLARPVQAIIHSPFKSLQSMPEGQDTGKDEKENAVKSPIEKLSEEVESLKLSSNEKIKERQKANTELNLIRQQQAEIEVEIEALKNSSKIHERTALILENPTENINKLEGLIEKTRERRLAVENQWQLHRNPALQQIEELQKIRQSKNLQSIHKLRSNIKELEILLKEKTHSHALLAEELKKASGGVASRNEYTRRIYEFIGNIRKQRTDIYKILDDTKDLQKQLNSIAAQLQRQFNYTDDLLFQSAKHDLHAKQAYKLLASLHASCNEICDLVSLTGQTTKECRDLEVQIDREHMRNVAASLEKITLDIQKIEMIINTMKSDINKVENEIHSG